MNIHLVTVAGVRSPTLAQMLQHYRDQGIVSIHVNVHASEIDEQGIAETRQVANDNGATSVCTTVAPWSQNINPLLYRMARAERPNDWFVLADTDEFHAYPDSLDDMVNFCDQKGYDYIEGCFVDRLATDGKLRAIIPDSSLWAQFPLGAFLSGPLLGAVANKVVAAKGSVRIGPGQHHAFSGNACPPSDIYVPVHHFKWTEGLLDRLRTRIAAYKALQEGVWIESDTFIRYYEREGRIRTDDERFLVGSCCPEYEYWYRVKQWKTASFYFRRF
jgi:hypothetical protein